MSTEAQTLGMLLLALGAIYFIQQRQQMQALAKVVHNEERLTWIDYRGFENDVMIRRKVE